MKNNLILLLIRASFSSLLLFGCASWGPSTDSNLAPVAKSASTERSLEAEQNRKALAEKKQAEEDRNRLLNRKNQVLEKTAANNPQNKSLLIENNAKTARTDSQIYEQILNSYQRNDQVSLTMQLQAMEERFPQSPMLADSLYLRGTLSVLSKNYGMALKDFNRIVREYPTSHRLPSVIFAKASVYRRMHLPGLAKNLFAQVAKNYPGSPEATRAQLEIKLTK